MYSSFDLDIYTIGDVVSVKGILSEYSPDFPTDRTYKLFLRTPDDIQSVGIPSYYIQLMMMASGVFIVFVIGWAVSLRQRVDSKTKEIQLSLKQKELLLKEIHHRVKNSLSIVSGLIEIQLSSTDNKEATDILQNSQTRIQSVAMIHEKLYKTDSLNDIELDVYIKDLVESIHFTFTEYRESVDLCFDLEPVSLDTSRAVHCGLLINELVVNAFKYAFSSDKQGTLSITLKKENGKITFGVADNGPGLPCESIDNGSDSLGTMLIDTFASHLKATKKVSERDGGGAVFEFTFPQ
jgi:two-component sensor histidine kinase